MCDVDWIPEQARKLLSALSSSGLQKHEKLELSEMAQNAWDGWKINVDNIEYERKPNGDRKRVGEGGFAAVFRARMRRRDENGSIIDGKYMEVAVKRFIVPRPKAEEMFPQFMREVFLQKHAQHPCIVRTFGGYWPAPDEVEDGDEVIEPIIVMELMTHNLRDVLNKGLVNSLVSKHRVLTDIAAGIEHLHNCGIVHRDVKPENVLLRVVDGAIVGIIKVCDFGISRKAHATDLMTHNTQVFTKPTGSSHYMPPEAFNNSVRDSSKRARDIWSFGVLICEVVDPHFLSNLVHAQPNVSGTDFGKKVAESASTISCNESLRDLALSCLSLDPELRPTIAAVVNKLATLDLALSKNSDPIVQKSDSIPGAGKRSHGTSTILRDQPQSQNTKSLLGNTNLISKRLPTSHVSSIRRLYHPPTFTISSPATTQGHGVRPKAAYSTQCCCQQRGSIRMAHPHSAHTVWAVSGKPPH